MLLALSPLLLGGEAGCRGERVAPAPVKIGAVLPLSGERASYGRDALNGILAAVESINRGGGLRGRRVEIIVANNHSKPEGTRQAVSKLGGEHVIAIVGPLASGNAVVAAREAEERRVPLVLPAATLMGVTEAGTYVSRVCFTNRFQAYVVAHFAWEFLRARSFALFTEEGSQYSQELARFFVEAVGELGGEVRWVGQYRPGQTHFDSLLGTLASAPVDAVFLPGYYGEVGAFLEEAGERGLEVPILGGDGWDVPGLVDSSVWGGRSSYFAAHFAADEPSEAVAEFMASYTTKYGYPPHSLAALGYDAVSLVVDALGRAAGDAREDLKNAINSTRGFRGLTGTLSLDANRDSVKSAVILKMTRKGFEFIDRIGPQAVAGFDSAHARVPSGLLAP